MVQKMIKLLVVLLLFVPLVLFGSCCLLKDNKKVPNFFPLMGSQEIQQLFPSRPDEINRYTKEAISDAYARLKSILTIPAARRTKENFLIPLDELFSLSNVSIVRNASGVLEKVSPREDVRKAAHNAVQEMNDFWVDAVENNKDLYLALKAYAVSDDAQTLSTEQHYFLTKMLEDYERNGVNLPDDKRNRAAILKKELAKLAQDFATAIASDNRTIEVSKDKLAGLDEDFIATLQPTPEGNFRLGVDYPTYFAVMEKCTVESTRKKLYRAFSNRAHPLNESTLSLVIAKRDELAQLLGFESFAHLDLDDQMVKTPDRAYQFLDELLKRGVIKEQQEFERLVAELPESVTLTAEGKFKPWDTAFIKAQFKKKHYNIDEQAIAEYFPMQKTIEGLLDIYRQFFSLEFKQVPVQGLWHSDVELIEVYDAKNQQLLGHLLLDLYPRPNKFTHACYCDIIPAVIDQQGNTPPALALVIANFPKASATKPSLLKRADVNTFFHEFGHALHGLLGRTKVASLSGTNVKMDFVEMPSQMLEEWLWDPAILKQISHHHKTGAQLPDALIAQILQLKHFDSGSWLIRQLGLSSLSLDYYASGANKNVYEVMRSLMIRTMPHVAFDEDNHFYASFGHLMGYGAKYYGYLWSKVFALDLFNEIKQQGLLNPAIGSKYVREVIGRGGSKDPNELLANFLGREPNQDAFFKDLGI